MQENDPNNIRIQAAKEFIDKLDANRDRGALLAWVQGVDILILFTNDYNLLKTNIDNVDSNGGTNINNALSQSIDLFEAKKLQQNVYTDNAINAIIIITDGKSDYTPSNNVDSLVNYAITEGYKIFSIGLSMISGSKGENVLKNMALLTGGQYYFPPSPENLQSIFDSIFNKVSESRGKNIYCYILCMVL